MRKSNNRWTIEELRDKRHLVEFPEYQREPTVWSLEKKRRLIDSILRGFDIASIYFFKKEDGTYDCIDGRQRISASDLTPENSNSGKESPPGKIGHSKEGSWH